MKKAKHVALPDGKEFHRETEPRFFESTLIGGSARSSIPNSMKKAKHVALPDGKEFHRETEPRFFESTLIERSRIGIHPD